MAFIALLGAAVACTTVALVLAVWPAYGAGKLPVGFLQSRVAGGLAEPTTMTFAPDGRLFVAEQGGAVRVIEGNRLLATPFLDVSNKVDSKGARGLLGIAFDPEFSANGYV